MLAETDPAYAKPSGLGTILKRKTSSYYKITNDPNVPPLAFDITPEQLKEVVDFDNRHKPEQLEVLAKYGGVEGIAEKLETNTVTGIPAGEKAHGFQRRTRIFGNNFVPPPKPVPLYRMVFEQLKSDRILQILLLGAVVNLALGMAFEGVKTGWIEGFAIFVAVIIVVSVTCGNDYIKELKFRKIMMLNSDKVVKVIRGGEIEQISSLDVKVGDLVSLEQGNEIPADGLFVTGKKCSVDESALTGETVPEKKSPTIPYLFSGTCVSEGTAMMLVTAVGPRSTGGMIQALLNEQRKQPTPLQEKLSVLAKHIGYFAFTAGILTFLGLAIRWAVVVSTEDWEWTFLETLVEDFVLGVTIIVVAVPEGLPLAVTICLAYSMVKMVQDKNFVRHLRASEIMGEATCVCSDKTGTLTENRMTVTSAFLATNPAGAETGDTAAEDIRRRVAAGQLNAVEATRHLSSQVVQLITENVCVNSTCSVFGIDTPNPNFVGNKTEGALLVFAHKLGANYEELRRAHRVVGDFAFSSERKRMSTIIALPEGSVTGNYRVHCKGASELVLALCTSWLDRDGTVRPLTTQQVDALKELIVSLNSSGLRTLTLAYRDINELPDESVDQATAASRVETDMTFVGIVGIKDPVRPEVPDAVAQCQRAGLTVRMVTGDNILTAKHIAIECGILTQGGLAMEGPEFRKLDDAQRRAIIPRLQVLARSSPQDKFILVSTLKAMGEVVAVTGDGTNDGPALKEADVGFSMGIAGTDIAKNASDIVLLDDNFRSIVRAILWGRNVFDCIRKFLQFQLSVNVTAIITVFVVAVATNKAPYSPVQLLWTNLIMDTFGALALATDRPARDILDRPPHKRNETVLTATMLIYIGCEALFQVFIQMMLRFYAYRFFGVDGDDVDKINTLMFTTHILLQVTNEFNARALGTEINPFRGFHRNPYFICIMVFIVVVQAIMVTFGGEFLRTVPLNADEWGGCIIIALLNIPYGFLVRLVIRLRASLLGRNKHVVVRNNIGRELDDFSFSHGKEPELAQG